MQYQVDLGTTAGSVEVRFAVVGQNTNDIVDYKAFQAQAYLRMRR